MIRTLPALVVLVVLAGCGATAPDPDGDFDVRLAGHYHVMIDPDAKPAVRQKAREACGQLASGNVPFPAVVLVLRNEGGVTGETAEAIARAAVDVYCPDQQPKVPAQ